MVASKGTTDSSSYRKRLSIPMAVFAYGNLVLWLCLFAGAAWPADSGQPATPDTPKKVKTAAAVVAVSLGEFRLPVGAPVAMRSGVVFRREDSVGTAEVSAEIKTLLKETFQRRGNPFVPREEADYLIAVALVTDSAINDEDIARLFGLRTMLSASRKRHEKGTLILGIVRKGEDHFSWRGAIQILEYGKKVRLVNRQVLEPALAKLVAKIPRR